MIWRSIGLRPFAAARLIVGPYGLGLANAAYAAPNAALCELRPLNDAVRSPNSDDFFFALAAALQLGYGVCVADNPPGADDWQCDIPKALELVDPASTGQALNASWRSRRDTPRDGGRQFA